MPILGPVNGRVILRRRRAATPEGGFDSDAQNYFDRIVAAGSTISDPHKNAVNTFVLAAKAHGYWTKLVECNPFAGANLTAALVKLKYNSGIAPGTNNNHGFTSGDYTEALGLKGDGASWLGTGVLISEVGANIGLSFFLNERDLAEPGNGAMVGAAINFGDDRLLWFYQGALISEMANPISSQAWSYSLGLYHGLRTGTTTAKCFINGVKISTDATSSSTARSAEIGVFATGDGVFPNTYLGGFYAIDDGTMTDGQAADFGKDVRDLVWDMERSTPIEEMEYVPFDGQSLASGHSSTPGITTTADTNNNRMPTTGDVGLMGGDIATNVLQANFPLARTFSSGGRETPALGFIADRQNTIIATFGKGGEPYTGLKKGTAYYDKMMADIATAKLQSREYSTAFILRAVMFVHGESDEANTDYDDNLLEFVADLQADLRTAGIIGPSDTIMLFVSQIASWSETKFTAPPGNATHVSSLKMIDASRADSRIIVVCPKYFLEHGSDGVHLTAASSHLLGRYYNKAYKQVFEDETPWANFAPTLVERTGNVVTLTYPRTDLVFDTSAVAEATNKGFEWSGGGVSISSVAIGGPNDSQVIITLSGTPTGGGYRVRYAYTATNLTGDPDVDTGARLDTGPRGNLRDSHATLPDWALIIDEPCS